MRAALVSHILHHDVKQGAIPSPVSSALPPSTLLLSPSLPVFTPMTYAFFLQ